MTKALQAVDVFPSASMHSTFQPFSVGRFATTIGIFPAMRADGAISYPPPTTVASTPHWAKESLDAVVADTFAGGGGPPPQPAIRTSATQPAKSEARSFIRR